MSRPEQGDTLDLVASILMRCFILTAALSRGSR